MRITALSVLLTTVFAGPVLAQGGQSATDLVRGLRPRPDGMNLGGERGIGLGRPPSVATPAMPPSRPSQAAPPQARAPAAQPAPAAAPSADLSVEFRSGSADLTPAARRALNELGKALSDSQLAPYRFRIEGHTDTVGAPAANRTLSERRAAVVVDYLNTQFGVDRARLEAVGMGEDMPLIPTGPQMPEPRNRRVHVVNLGA